MSSGQDHPVVTPPARRMPWIGAVLLLVAIAVPFVVRNPTTLNLVILVLMAAQLGVAWNLLGGYAGQVSLGHAAFYGVGAYTSSLALMKFGINPWLGMLGGGAVAAVLSLAFGWGCFRLKGHYFAMATIAVAELVQIVFNNWDYAGSAVGLTLPMDRTGWLWMQFNDKQPYYWLALGLLALTLGATSLIERSHIGYYLRAIKDEPDAARSIGIDISRYKQVALCTSAFFTAMGGSLYAQKELYIDPPSVLSTALSIKMALVSILGGIGTLFGPVLGSAVLTTIEELSRAYFGGTGSGIDTILYAALIIAISVFYPSGVVGWWRAWSLRRRARQLGGDMTAAAEEALQ
ncbi:MAG TPA: branched-chain amino acid ABC transporter permease [Burkholderiaceae bacterium]